MLVEQRLYKKNEFIEFVDLSMFGPLEVPIPQKWYALELHPNREARVTRTFRQRNISFYFPTVTQSRLISRRRRGYEVTVKRDVTSPLFPGLIFIPDFQCKLGGVLDVDGVSDFLRFGSWTAYLKADLMADVRTLERYGNIPVARRNRLFKIGELVRVVEGPFASFNGIIDRLDSNARLSVLVDLFKRMVPVMLDEDQVEAV